MSRVVTANDVKVLTEEERKAKRAEKFGFANKLEERAKRFGVASGDEKATVSNVHVPSGVDSERLKKRAERFGVVSDVVKKIDADEKLNKRKQRFNAGNASSPINDEVKRKRMERFSGKPLATNNIAKTSPKKETEPVTVKNNGQSSEANKVS